MVGVDAVFGPLIKPVILNTRKTRRHLAMDLTGMGFLQFAAWSYELWTVFAARPVHMRLEYHHMAAVYAVDVDLPRWHKQRACERCRWLVKLCSRCAPLKALIKATTSPQPMAGVLQAAKPALRQS